MEKASPTNRQTDKENAEVALTEKIRFYLLFNFLGFWHSIDLFFFVLFAGFGAAPGAATCHDHNKPILQSPFVHGVLRICTLKFHRKFSHEHDDRFLWSSTE